MKNEPVMTLFWGVCHRLYGAKFEEVFKNHHNLDDQNFTNYD